MSLINETYKDLQKRTRSILTETEHGALLPPALLVSDESYRKNTHLFALIAICCIVLLSIVIFPSKKNSAWLFPPIPTMLAPSSSNLSTPNVPITNISKLSLSFHNDIHELNVHVSQIPHYIFRTDKKRGLIYIIFNESNTNPEIENIHLDSSVFEFVHLKSLSQNRSQLELKLPSGFNLEYLKTAEGSDNRLTLGVTIPIAHPVENGGYSVKSSSREDEKRSFYNDALKLLSNGEETAAIDRFLFLLNDDPYFESARKSLAVTYLKRNDPSSAINLMEDGLKLNPDSQDLILLNAHALILSKQEEKSILFLSQHMNKINKEEELYLLLGEAYSNLNRWDEVVQIYNQLCQKFPSNSQYWIFLGEAYYSQNKLSLSKQAFKEALRTPNLDSHTKEMLVKKLGHMDYA